MNAERLLAHYERIADAPDAIERLRRFILELAMHGKLVEQDPNDEPAVELLKKIAAEKERLVKVGEIKKQSALPLVATYEALFSVPNVWEWTRIGSAAYVEMGQSPPSEHYNRTGHGIPFFQGKADFGKRYPTARYWCTQPKKYAAPGDILISVRAPVGPTNVASEPCCIGRGLAALRSHNGIDRYYLLRCLEAFEHALAALGFGTTFVAINKNQLIAFVIPLPPLVEQHRIVAKVDELMALCDRLEAARTERESTRNRMAAASLVRLNDPDSDPVVFRNHAAFALENLAPLTTRTDQIKSLRQTILNLAVRGKLVEQDPNDEPASELLKRVAAARMLVPASGRKTKKLFSDSPLAEVGFPLPAGWVSTQLSELVRVVNGRAYKKAELLESGTPVLRVGNLFTSNHWYYSNLELEEDKHCDVGDLIYAWSASFGPFIWQGPRVIYHYHIWKLPLFSEADIDKRLLYFFLLQKTKEIKGAGHGISMAHMTKEKMEQLVVPLPPLAEQHRIVAKVDKLMALCDQLESSLTTGDETRRRLLETLLYEALPARRLRGHLMKHKNRAPRAIQMAARV